MKKYTAYIILFTALYAIIAFISLIHAVSFFGLANNSWMSVLLAIAFEIGQAGVLFAILTSSNDRKRIMPWVLMCILTAVQILGNVFSSYKYLSLNSSADLKFFKEPIFIWTSIPDNMANVIITYIVGAILPIVALCMTSMVANYLEDNKNSRNSEKNKEVEKNKSEESLEEKSEEKSKESLEEKSEEKSKENSEENLDNNSEEKLEESLKEKSDNNSEEKLEESSEENSEKNSDNNSEENSEEENKEKSHFINL